MKWTGDGVTFANANATETTFTLNAEPSSPVFVTAEFKIKTPWSMLQEKLNTSVSVSLDRDYIASETDGPLIIPSGRKVILKLNGYTLNRGLDSPTENG